MHVVICYDVTVDARRTRLMKRLRARLVHVQKSVFEGEISGPDLVELRGAVLDEIDPGTDTVRIYSLCARCVPATEVLGVGTFVETGDDAEIV